jgi:hypothetical protein
MRTSICGSQGASLSAELTSPLCSNEAIMDIFTVRGDGTKGRDRSYGHGFWHPIVKNMEMVICLEPFNTSERTAMVFPIFLSSSHVSLCSIGR